MSNSDKEIRKRLEDQLKLAEELQTKMQVQVDALKGMTDLMRYALTGDGQGVEATACVHHIELVLPSEPGELSVDGGPEPPFGHLPTVSKKARRKKKVAKAAQTIMRKGPGGVKSTRELCREVLKEKPNEWLKPAEIAWTLVATGKKPEPVTDSLKNTVNGILRKAASLGVKWVERRVEGKDVFYRCKHDPSEGDV